MRLASILVSATLAASFVPPAVYRCEVNRKVDETHTYTDAELERAKFSVIVRDVDGSAKISRCSFASLQGRVTCDDYRVAHIAVDPNIGARKYYVFDSQFDVQVFRDLSFVENNGRGSVSFGSCKMTPE